jgi:N-acetylneuraminic acid mutarotase
MALRGRAISGNWRAAARRFGVATVALMLALVIMRDADFVAGVSFGPSIASAAVANPAPLLVARRRLGLAALGSKVYAAGGEVGQTERAPILSAALDEYDPATNTWTGRAPLPSPREDISLVALGGSLYAIGGVTQNGDTLALSAEVLRYDPTPNVWTPVAPYPVQVAGHGAVVSGGKIYVVGGMTGSNIIYAFDPSLNSWTPKAPMPTTRTGVRLVAANDGRIFVLGGYSDSAVLNIVEVYTPATDSWTTAAPLPYAGLYYRGYAAALGSNGKIYTFGETLYPPIAPGPVFEYDLATNQWTQRASIPTPRVDASATLASDGRVYVVGGFEPQRNSGGFAVSAIAETYDALSDSWSQDLSPLTFRGISINGGAPVTSIPQVYLVLDASPPPSGSSQNHMSTSIDGGVTWSGWEPLQGLQRLWGLSGSDGLKQVQIRVRDRFGTVSPPQSAQITLDTSHGTWFGPLINGGEPSTNSLDVTLNIVPAPWMAEMRIANTMDLSGATWEPITKEKAWRLAPPVTPSTPSTVYIQFRATFGNPGAGYADNIVVDQTPPTGSVAVTGASGARVLQLTATDDYSSSAQMQMRVSNRSDFTGAVWQWFSGSLGWGFSGSQPVHVQFKDGAGNISQTYTQTAEGSSTGISCLPRPRIDVHTQAVGGTLQVTVTATGSNNGLRSVRFASLANAVVNVGSQQNQTAPFAVSIPSGQEPTALQFVVQRRTAGQATTVQLVVIDGCGEWSTFVGGGPSAF